MPLVPVFQINVPVSLEVWKFYTGGNERMPWVIDLTDALRTICQFRHDPIKLGVTGDEMVGWHHRLNGHEFEQALGDGDGQGSLVWCNPWGHKSWTRLRDWTTTAELCFPVLKLIGCLIGFCLLVFYVKCIGGICTLLGIPGGAMFSFKRVALFWMTCSKCCRFEE